MEIVFRLAVATLVIVMPSVLFVGFYRGMLMLRDDRLIERVYDGHRRRTGGSLAPEQFVPDRVAPERGTPDLPGQEGVPCPDCGTPNPSDVTYCQGCLVKLD
jgi:hypothetical protein